MKKRNGFTILESLISIIVLSIILLTIFGTYTQFKKIKDEVDAKVKLKNFSELAYNSLYDINKVSAILKSTPIISNVDDTLTLEYNNIGYYNNNGDYIENILEDSKLANFDLEDSDTKEALENFFNVSFDNDLLFYRNLFYFCTTQTEKLFGFINVSYKKFTFIHINDPKFVNYLKGSDITDEALEEMFNTTKDYLVINTSLDDDSAVTNGYVKSNWNNIRKKINIYKFTTREQIYEPIKYIKEQMEESQKKINDWATIQARYEAHKSVATGNTLNTDYFITCKKNSSSSDENCIETGATDEEDILSTNTLIKLDDGTSSSSTNRESFYVLDEEYGSALSTSPINYGFLVLTNETTYQSSTNGCEISYTTEDGISYVIENALTFNGIDTNVISSSCYTTNAMNAFLDKFNVFNLPIMFSNALDSYLSIDDSGEEDITLSENRYPNGTIQAPYNATLFTILPNNEIIRKKLYGHIF